MLGWGARGCCLVRERGSVYGHVCWHSQGLLMVWKEYLPPGSRSPSYGNTWVSLVGGLESSHVGSTKEAAINTHGARRALEKVADTYGLPKLAISQWWIRFVLFAHSIVTSMRNT